MEISKELEAKIQQADSVEDVVQVCAEAGIAVTKEQLLAADLPEGELDENALDLVSGGVSVLGGAVALLIWGIYKAGKGSGGGGGHRF